MTAVTLGDAQAAAKTLYATPHIVQAPETAVAQPSAAEATAANQSATPTATEPKRTRKAKKSESAAGGEKKLSALDAAAERAGRGRPPHDLQGNDRGDGGEGLLDIARRQDARRHSCTPPSSARLTPRATEARFVKTERGKFARKA